jgi:hypothetical protein
VADYTAFGTGAVTGAADGAASGFSLGMEFVVSGPAWLTGLRFWRVSTNDYGTPIGRVYSVSTPTTGTAVPNTDATFASYAAGGTTGWKEATTTAPVRLTVNQRYRVAIRFSNYFPATNSYWASGSGSAGRTSGPLFAYAYGASTTSTTSTIQGSYIAGTTLSFPNTLASPTGNNYWVDVTVTDVDPTGLSQNQFVPFL